MTEAGLYTVEAAKEKILKLQDDIQYLNTNINKSEKEIEAQII